MDQDQTRFEDWAARQAAEIGRRVAQRRKQLHLGGEELAGRCAALGMPSFTRQVIMRLEHKRRESITVPELSVLAAALEISPVLLAYPLGQADQAEYLPGHWAPPFDAARWWSGEIAVSAKGDMYRGERRLPATLFRDHDQLIREIPPSFTEIAYTRARRRGAGTTPEDREYMFAVIALREVRESIRDAGLLPPQLPRELAWVDDPDT